MPDFNKKIFVGVTCTSERRKKRYWKDQLKEIKKIGIKQITLFPTTLNKKEREEMYKQLEKSGVEEIKLVHLRGEDFENKELEYFYNRFKTRLFNCHEICFDQIYKKFPKFRKNILLEPDFDNRIENKMAPNKMGGFCVDLAHFKVAKECHYKEYDYIKKHFKDTKFQANHLNGYSHKLKRDLHFVNNIKQFDYLKNLPKKIFGKVIALELENSIKTQLKFKKYLVNILNKKWRT